MIRLWSREDNDDNYWLLTMDLDQEIASMGERRRGSEEHDCVDG